MNDQKEKVAGFFRQGEIIDFVSLARALWQWRVFIVSGFALLTVIGALIVFLAPGRFRSEAVFQIGTLAAKNQDKSFVEKASMPSSFFKEGEARLYDLENMRALMAQDPGMGKKVKKDFFAAHETGEEIKKYFRNIYNVSKIAQLPKGEETAVSGFKLFFEAETPDVALSILNFFGNYIRSNYLAIDLGRYIRENSEHYGRSIRENEIKTIERNEVLQRLNNRKDKVLSLGKRFPKAGDADARMLSKIKNPSIFYLSPDMQLRGIESMIVASHHEIERLAWQRELSLAASKFFSRAIDLLERDGKDGVALLAKMNDLRRELFDGKAEKSRAVSSIANSLSKDLQRFQDIYHGVFAFTSGPVAAPDRTAADRIKRLLGIMIFNLLLVLLLAVMLNWGKRNWQKMTAINEE